MADDTLTITGFEVVPVLVPLARESRGSHYRMPNRATVIVRAGSRSPFRWPNDRRDMRDVRYRGRRQPPALGRSNLD
jgi:hypothetical protein